MTHSWDVTDRMQSNYVEKYLSYFHIYHHKSSVDCLRIARGPPAQEAGG